MTSYGDPAVRPPARRTLTRSREYSVLGGVCGGIAEFLGWRPTTVRLMFVLSCILPGPQVVAYLILRFVMPKEPRTR